MSISRNVIPQNITNHKIPIGILMIRAVKITIVLLWALSIISYAEEFAPEAELGRTEEIKVNINSEGIDLSARIVKPINHQKKLPAVVFLVGSGELSTLENNRELTDFFFDESLPKQGFAVIYFDKRGVGGSEGVWYNTTFEERALDARNVAVAAGKLDFIDEDRIFVVGHSQGGWITQIALSKYPEVFSGGISMAGPTFGVRRQLVNDYKSRFECSKGMSEEQAVKSAHKKVKRDLFFVSLIGFSGNLKQLKLIKDFDPAPFLKSIEQPILLMFGENDPLVSPEWSIEALNELFPEAIPENIEFYIAPGQEHSFKVTPACFSGDWSQVSYAETTRQKIVDWLNSNR